MTELTRRQQEVLDYILQTQRESGYPPTRAEISEHFGFRSPNAAESHLRMLERKGVIRVQSGVSRGIQVMGQQGAKQVPVQSLPTGKTVAYPLVGRVAAGSPLLATENIEDYYNVDAALFRPKPDYLLRIDGQSMRDVGMLHGDLLLVHKTPEARDGQIVVARIEDEVTVKRYFRRGSQIKLVAENADYEPIVVDLSMDEFHIEGLGVGVIRTHME